MVDHILINIFEIEMFSIRRSVCVKSILFLKVIREGQCLNGDSQSGLFLNMVAVKFEYHFPVNNLERERF